MGVVEVSEVVLEVLNDLLEVILVLVRDATTCNVGNVTSISDMETTGVNLSTIR